MNLTLYVFIALIIDIILLIYCFIKDSDILLLDIIIQDIAESMIIGSSWIVSIPILIIQNILLCIIYMFEEDE